MSVWEHRERLGASSLSPRLKSREDEASHTPWELPRGEGRVISGRGQWSSAQRRYQVRGHLELRGPEAGRGMEASISHRSGEEEK